MLCLILTVEILGDTLTSNHCLMDSDQRLIYHSLNLP